MAEQLPTIGIHPGWYIAASVVCWLLGYLLMAGLTARIVERLTDSVDVSIGCAVFWPITLPLIAGYHWAKACEPKDK